MGAAGPAQRGGVAGAGSPLTSPSPWSQVRVVVGEGVVCALVAAAAWADVAGSALETLKKRCSVEGMKCPFPWAVGAAALSGTETASTGGLPASFMALASLAAVLDERDGWPCTPEPAGSRPLSPGVKETRFSTR